MPSVDSHILTIHQSQLRVTMGRVGIYLCLHFRVRQANVTVQIRASQAQA